MKKKFIYYFMRMAELTADLSYAKRLTVGALIVKGNQIIGTGYNGMPADWDNITEEKESMPDFEKWKGVEGKIIHLQKM